MVNVSMERWVQRTYMVVMQEMFVEVKRYNTEALAIEGPPVYEPSNFEKVANCCCQAYMHVWKLYQPLESIKLKSS